MKRLAIFGSGAGSNAQNICAYFAKSNIIKVVCICTNNKKGGIVSRAKEAGVPVLYTTSADLQSFCRLQKSLQDFRVDYILLAGFLIKIPLKMIGFYEKKIINIHPSLLPKYGGKGMYGKNVHRAVLENNEIESGITIHFVNEEYDKGEIILQEKCSISKKETVSSLEKKIRLLEFRCLPRVIENIILNTWVL